MLRRAQISKLPEAHEFIKEMNPDGQMGRDLEEAMRGALAKVLQDKMASSVDRRLAELAALGLADRRNGYYHRHLLTGIGDIELLVPRTRTYSPNEVLRAYARRTREVDQLILGGFVLGLSTRKVSKALLPLLGERISPSSVSRVAKTLDRAVAAFHVRPLRNCYRALVFDGVMLSRKTGAGAIKRPVLVALGILADGRKEIIDYRLARSESQAEWEHFFGSLYERGLTGKGVEVIVVDGGAGCLAALPTVYHEIPVQRCWAHKVRNVTDKVRRADRDAVKKSLQRIYNAPNLQKARQAARRFADRWEEKYPKAVRCLRDDLEALLVCFQFKDPWWRKQIRTTNAIE